MPRMPFVVAVAFALALNFAATPAQSQVEQDGFKACGDTDNLVLVFMNPDLNVQSDGFVHASGRFFIQFQARGPAAMDIDSLYFSFGKPAGPAVCDAPTEWYTEGVFLKNYRADFDWRDGFFVPINTYNVYDGEYIAALSAYDATGKELVRYWTKAIVENGCSPGPNDPPGTCEKAGYVVNDKIQPWPMILPGDGERFDGKDGLYIEVAEPVQEVKAWLGTHEGQKLLELTEITPPKRDDDVAPDVQNNPAGPSTLDCPVQLPTQCSKVWGHAWEWPGVVGDEAVIRVRLVDLNGNVAEKVVHVGDPTIGGRVTVGEIDVSIELDETQKETDENGTATWTAVFKSTTGVHGDLFVRMADGKAVEAPFTARVQPNHIMIGPDEQITATVRVVAGPEAQPGTYDMKLVVNYAQGTARVDKEVPLKLSVVALADKSPADDEEIADTSGEEVESTRGEDISTANTSTVVPEEAPKDTPSPALVLSAGAVAAAAAWSARRRRP